MHGRRTTPRLDGRQAARGMRRLRRLERARCRRRHRARPARAAAPRAGSDRHRLASTAAASTPTAAWAWSATISATPRSSPRCPGRTAIGHNRYATTGDTILRNVQPLYADFEFGGFAVAHNGNLTNAHVLRRALVRRGCLFQSTTDCEVFVHLIAISLYSTVVDRLIDALKQVVGAYSLVALSNEALMGVRDPLGVRPLILGRIGTEGTGGWVLASETCALDIVGADFVRDVEPGEIVVINDQGVHSIKPFGRTRERFCVFEYIYFARPDSVMEGTPVYERAQAHRRRTGAREPACRPTSIVPVPDSGVPAAMGYATESGIPFELGIIRNHYVGRTFIEPTDHIRHLGVKLKHSANRPVLEGKRVILVDDFDRARHHQPQDRRDGARRRARAEVHMRISSPPTTHSCFYGIDTPERGELLAARHIGGGDGRADRRRQPGVHLDRRAVSRARQARSRPGAAALLRCLLHRRLSDRAARPGGQCRAAAEPARREPLTCRRRLPDGRDRAGHRRQPRHRRGDRRGAGAARRARGDHRAHPGRPGRDRRCDPRSRAAARPCCRWTCAEGEQIDAIGPSLFQRFGRLDMLVHNAGALGRLTPVAHILPNDWADVVAVNLARHLAADPHLRSAAAQRRGGPRGVRHR